MKFNRKPFDSSGPFSSLREVRVKEGLFNPISMHPGRQLFNVATLSEGLTLIQECKLNQLQLGKAGRDRGLFPSLLRKSLTRRELQMGRKTTLGGGSSMAKGMEMEIHQ